MWTVRTDVTDSGVNDCDVYVMEKIIKTDAYNFNFVSVCDDTVINESITVNIHTTDEGTLLMQLIRELRD